MSPELEAEGFVELILLHVLFSFTVHTAEYKKGEWDFSKLGSSF
jgi:hypothetical protein